MRDQFSTTHNLDAFAIFKRPRDGDKAGAGASTSHNEKRPVMPINMHLPLCDDAPQSGQDADVFTALWRTIRGICQGLA